MRNRPTSSSQATENSHFEEIAFCPRFRKAVELVGRRWSGAVIRVLFGGPRRFNELLAAVPGMSDRLLTERLRELEAENLISREVQPGSPVRVVYSLTCAGAELQIALDALAHWAERWIEAPADEAAEIPAVGVGLDLRC